MTNLSTRLDFPTADSPIRRQRWGGGGGGGGKRGGEGGGGKEEIGGEGGGGKRRGEGEMRREEGREEGGEKEGKKRRGRYEEGVINPQRVLQYLVCLSVTTESYSEGWYPVQCDNSRMLLARVRPPRSMPSIGRAFYTGVVRA